MNLKNLLIFNLIKEKLLLRIFKLIFNYPGFIETLTLQVPWVVKLPNKIRIYMVSLGLNWAWPLNMAFTLINQHLS